MHGSGLTHIVWSLHEQFLASKGYSILALDLPAHGNSEGPAIKSIEEIELRISLKNSRVISNIHFYFPNGLKTSIKDGSKVKTEIIANNIANPVKIPK